MDTETQKLIDEQFQKLPSSLQEALNAVSWKSAAKEIALSNKMSPEQSETLEMETMFILYGFENPEDYVANLVRETGVDGATAANIAESAAEKIFKPISDKADEFESKSKPAEPTIITKEAKQEVMQNLAQRVASARQEGARINPAPAAAPVAAPEIHPVRSKELKIPSDLLPTNQTSNGIHPMVEPGEVAHTVPHVESRGPVQKAETAPAAPAATPIPKPAQGPHYEPGKDPYREPIE